MATFTFNADSSEVTGTSGVTKVGTTYQMNGTSAQIDIIADAGGGMALDHTTALESATGVAEYALNPSPVAVGNNLDDSFKAEFGFDTDLPLTGTFVGNQFLGDNPTDSRLCIDFGGPVTISGFRYSNGHSSGTGTNRGARATIFSSSDNAGDFTDVYATDINLTQLWADDFAKHNAVDEADWQEVVLSPVEVPRYGVFQFATNWADGAFTGVRRIEFKVVVDPDIDYDYTNDVGATNYVNAGNITALQGVTDTDFQNEKFRLNLTGVAGALWNSFIIQNYSADVIAPTDPTGAKATDAEVWGMWWVQSPEGSTIIAQLKRIIDGTTTYLAKVANLPVWQEASPTTWWTFARDNTGADTPFNAFETDDVAGTAIAYYVRFIDLSDNVSSWTAFTESAGGFTPATPALDSVSVGDGSITFNVTPNVETDEVYARVRRNSPAYTWEDKSESFKRTGSGAITVTGLINGIEYECAAQTMDGGILGTGSDFGGSRFAMPDSDAFAVSRYNEKLNERNGTARVNWEVARRRGVKVTFKNGPDADAVVYAKVAQPSTVTIGVRTGQIDRSDIVISVPRQTNFPPSRFYPNATFTLNTKSYQIDNVDFDNEDINMTAIFILTASVLGIEDGY